MINACVFINVVDLHKYKTKSQSKISLPLKLVLRIYIRKKNSDFSAKLKRIKRSVMLLEWMKMALRSETENLVF